MNYEGLELQKTLTGREAAIRTALTKHSFYDKLILGEDRKRVKKRGYRIMDFLLRPDLFSQIVAEANRFIVGETATIKTLHLCAAGRLVKNHQVASYNLMVNSESGAGKDFVTTHTLKALPKTQYFSRTRISPTVFNYWHANDKEWTWDGKVLYLEDISSGVLNADAFKVMSSNKSHTTIVKDQRAIELEVRGKPVIIVTTASGTPTKEMTRRFPIINLDESVDQTKAIIKRHAEAEETGLPLEPNDDITDALSWLRRVYVKVPFAKKITDFFPDQILIRTHFPRFLDLIKASAALHQYQRESDEHGRVIAEPADYDIARDILLKLTSNPLMVSLTRNQQRIRGYLAKNKAWLSAGDMEPHMAFISGRQLRRELDRLFEAGLLQKDYEDRANSRRPVMVFRLVEMVDLKIPSWSEIMSSLSSQSTLSNMSSMSNDNPAYKLIDINDILDITATDKRLTTEEKLCEVSEVKK